MTEPTLPDALEGHWATASGREMAMTYSTRTRQELGLAEVTDFQLANDQFMTNGDIVLQTASKERIRWLSVQLAMAQARLAKAEEFGELLKAAAARKRAPEAEDGKVYINVSGLTGTGKSAVYIELVVALQALGLTVEHADPDEWRMESGMLSVDGNNLGDCKPVIVLSETNIPRKAV